MLRLPPHTPRQKELHKAMYGRGPFKDPASPEGAPSKQFGAAA